MRCASDSERQVSEQVGEWAISMMADSCFDGERQVAPTSPFSSRRGGRRCHRIAAVRGRCRRGVVSPPSDKPYSTLDKVNQKTFWSDSSTENVLVLSREREEDDGNIMPTKNILLQFTSYARCACA